MKKYKVSETRTIYVTHIIEAESAEEARRKYKRNEGLWDILEDDSETEYEVEEYVPEEGD